MARLRLWLARLLLPRGWVALPAPPEGQGRAYRLVRAGETLCEGEAVGLLHPLDNIPPGYYYGVDWARDNDPLADTLGQEDVDGR